MTQETQYSVEQLYQEIELRKGDVALRDAALKLRNNRDFKKLILEDFCGVRCANYVKQSVSRAIPEADREHALLLAQAAGHLENYLEVVVLMGNKAERDIEEIRAMIEGRDLEEYEE